MKLVLLTVLIMVSGAAGQAEAALTCSVAEFRTDSNDDKAFVEENLSKEFQVIVGEKEIVVKSFLDSLLIAEERYLIVKDDILAVYGIQNSQLFLNSIGVSKSLKEDTADAIFSINAAAFVSTWVLDCKDAG